METVSAQSVQHRISTEKLEATNGKAKTLHHSCPKQLIRKAVTQAESALFGFYGCFPGTCLGRHIGQPDLENAKTRPRHRISEL